MNTDTDTNADILQDPRVTAQIDVSTLDERETVLLKAMLDEDNLAEAGFISLDDFIDQAPAFDRLYAKQLASVLDIVHTSEGGGFSFDFIGDGEIEFNLYEVSMWHRELECWIGTTNDIDYVDAEHHRVFSDPPMTSLRIALEVLSDIDRTAMRARRAFDKINRALGQS